MRLLTGLATRGDCVLLTTVPPARRDTRRDHCRGIVVSVCLVTAGGAGEHPSAAGTVASITRTRDTSAGVPGAGTTRNSDPNFDALLRQKLAASLVGCCRGCRGSAPYPLGRDALARGQASPLAERVMFFTRGPRFRSSEGQRHPHRLLHRPGLHRRVRLSWACRDMVVSTRTTLLEPRPSAEARRVVQPGDVAR